MLEKNHRKEGEYDKCNSLLNYFELYEAERTTHFSRADSIGRNLKYILEERKSPADENNGHQAKIFPPVIFFEFKVAIPRQCHEDIAGNE